MQGLLVSVYRNASNNGYDCTNGGISSKHDMFVLVGDGVPEIFTPNEKHPAIRLIKRKVRGLDEFYIAIPIETGFCAGFPYMFGGNFLYTSDSRFPSDAPIKIFDRLE